MPCDFTHMQNLGNKTNEQTKEKRDKKKKTKNQTLKYREQTGGCQREGGWKGWVKYKGD